MLTKQLNSKSIKNMVLKSNKSVCDTLLTPLPLPRQVKQCQVLFEWPLTNWKNYDIC